MASAYATSDGHAQVPRVAKTSITGLIRQASVSASMALSQAQAGQDSGLTRRLREIVKRLEDELTRA